MYFLLKGWLEAVDRINLLVEGRRIRSKLGFWNPVP